MTEAAPKKTPLYDEHVRLGAKMIPFGDWIMPVQYSGIIDEHQAGRKNGGVFDIPHMGQLVATGPQAGAWLNEMLTNNIDKLEAGTGQYTFLLNERGGIIDDLIVYRTAPETFLLVVNASRTDEDFTWLQKHLGENAKLENRSSDFGRLTIARTGYTGEDGVEVFFPAGEAAKVWNDILAKGKELGIRPCGLGARDTLRLEMCYPLNGSDLSPYHNPIEAGLGFFVDLAKPEFVGRDVLVKAKADGPAQRLPP